MTVLCEPEAKLVFFIKTTIESKKIKKTNREILT